MISELMREIEARRVVADRERSGRLIDRNADWGRVTLRTEWEHIADTWYRPVYVVRDERPGRGEVLAAIGTEEAAPTDAGGRAAKLARMYALGIGEIEECASCWGNGQNPDEPDGRCIGCDGKGFAVVAELATAGF